MTLSLGLLGVGRIGRVHAANIAATPDARLAAVADADADAAAAVAAEHASIVRGTDEIVADPEIAAVVIATPTHTHADLVERLACAGKAVLCEKPIDLDLDRARACLREIERTGTTLMVGFNRRFDPHFRALKVAVAEGRIGAVEQVAITSRDPGLPPTDYLRTSGGLFRDMTIHDFDMARFLLDAPVTSVFATASALVEPGLRALGDYDTATVVLGTGDGRQAVISNSRRAVYGYDQRIEVAGARGTLWAENQRPAAIEFADAHGFCRPPIFDFFAARYREAYAAEIRHFVAAVTGTAPREATGTDGIMALELAEAANRSLAANAPAAVDAPD